VGAPAAGDDGNNTLNRHEFDPQPKPVENIYFSSRQYILVYDDEVFDAERHIRYTGASTRDTIIKRYLWPALVERASMRVVHKAVVIT
jgi:hypothetical protein